MSRIGKKPIALPKEVTVTIKGSEVSVKGPLGTLVKTFSPLIKIEQQGSELLVVRSNEEKFTRQLHGTTRALIATMVEGVTKGYKKGLEIKGIGFRAEVVNNAITLKVGYTHTTTLKALPTVKLETPTPTEIVVSGPDKQAVGQMAALIRDVRRPEPYQGKGIAYKGEYIRRKEGKKAGAGATTASK